MSDTNILADVKNEGEVDPFAGLITESNEEKETPSESPAENNPQEDKPDQGDKVADAVANTDQDNIPFHKHPRWIEREEELKELRAFKETIEPKLSEFEQFRSQVEPRLQHETTAIPKWFSNLYGENSEAWGEYQEYGKGLKEEIKNEIVEEQRQAYTKQQQEVQYWDKWVDSEVGKLATDPEIRFDLKDRNELIKTILDYKPTDENGHFDFKAGLKIMQALKVGEHEMKDNKLNERKKIASGTVQSPKGEAPRKDFLTTDDLRNKSWSKL